jgi:hypothetical protein
MVVIGSYSKLEQTGESPLIMDDQVLFCFEGLLLLQAIELPNHVATYPK